MALVAGPQGGDSEDSGVLGADSLPLALFTNGYRITKLVDSYDPKLIERKEQAKAEALARIHGLSARTYARGARRPPVPSSDKFDGAAGARRAALAPRPSITTLRCNVGDRRGSTAVGTVGAAEGRERSTSSGERTSNAGERERSQSGGERSNAGERERSSTRSSAC